MFLRQALEPSGKWSRAVEESTGYMKAYNKVRQSLKERGVSPLTIPVCLAFLKKLSKVKPSEYGKLAEYYSTVFGIDKEMLERIIKLWKAESNTHVSNEESGEAAEKSPSGNQTEPDGLPPEIRFEPPDDKIDEWARELGLKD